jgi:hypothetical protein
MRSQSQQCSVNCVCFCSFRFNFDGTHLIVPSQSMRVSLQILTIIMSDPCEIRFVTEPSEARNAVIFVRSKPYDVSSRQHLSKPVYKPGESESCYLGFDHTSTSTVSPILRNRVKSLTTTDIFCTLVPEPRSRKFSAPDLGTAEKQKIDQIHNCPNYFPQSYLQQRKRYLIADPNHNYEDSCCFSQCRYEDEESTFALDKFWLLQRGSCHKPALQQTNCKPARRKNEIYLVLDEGLYCSRNGNRNIQRISSSTRSISKTPACRRSRRSSRRESQPLGLQVPAVVISRQSSATSDTSGDSVDSRRRPIADPESDSAYEHTSNHPAVDTDKRRRLIVSVFTAFVILPVALAVLIISATLSIGAGGIGSA